MTNFGYNYDGNSKIELNFTNEPNSENKILWKKQGTENIILTLVYNKDAKVEDTKITLKEDVKLYDNNTLSAENSVIIDKQEKDAMVQISTSNTENVIYKV